MDGIKPALAGSPSPARVGLRMNPPAVPTPAHSPAPPQPIHRPLDPRTVSAVLAAIRTDSQRQTETFLRETVVPHGGE